MITDLHKLGIKFFNKSGADMPLTDFIPVFHDWIQNNRLDDLLIDVADYSHVPAGPGTMLIAHEGNYAIDETGNQRGFLYYSKHEVPGDTVAERLASVCYRNLSACKLLEEEERTRDRMSLDYGRMEIFSNDRLHGPRTDAALAAFKPQVEEFLNRLYPHSDYEIDYNDSDPRERLLAKVMIHEAADKADTLLSRTRTDSL